VAVVAVAVVVVVAAAVVVADGLGVVAQSQESHDRSYLLARAD